MIQKNVGKRFKGLLVTYDIKQNELANAANLSITSISDKLNGNTPITSEELLQFLQYINSRVPDNEKRDPKYVLGWQEKE